MTMTRPRILLLTHGRNHKKDNPGYRFLARNAWCFKHAVFIDIDASSYPTHVMDVTENNMDSLDRQFDYIFCMYTPCNVLRNKLFWYNVEAWLAPGGIVQTILPKYIRAKERQFARKICGKTGLHSVPKESYMTKNTRAVVFKKYV